MDRHQNTPQHPSNEYPEKYPMARIAFTDITIRSLKSDPRSAMKKSWTRLRLMF